MKKVFLKFSQNSQEDSCARVFFLIKLQALSEKGLWHRYFSANFEKFLKTSFFIEHLRWLLSYFALANIGLYVHDLFFRFVLLFLL